MNWILQLDRWPWWWLRRIGPLGCWLSWTASKPRTPWGRWSWRRSPSRASCSRWRRPQACAQLEIKGNNAYRYLSSKPVFFHVLPRAFRSVIWLRAEYKRQLPDLQTLLKKEVPSSPGDKSKVIQTENQKPGYRCKLLHLHKLRLTRPFRPGLLSFRGRPAMVS